MKTANYYNYLPQRFATDDVGANQVRRFIFGVKSGERKAVMAQVAKIMCCVAFRLQPIPSISAVSSVLQPR